MQALDRRDFLSLSLGAAAEAAWRNMLIINALGGLENPNLELSAAGTKQAVQGFDPASIDERALKDAFASGVNAVNVTLGYVSGDMEPFEYTIAQIGVGAR